MTIADATALDRAESDLDRTGSPLVWRPANELFEGAAECGFGFVAHFMRDGGNLGAAIGEPLRG